MMKNGLRLWLSLCYYCILNLYYFIKGALSDLKQFWATESPLKVMKNAFISS